MYSMTGFGKGGATAAGASVNIEIASVNRKQLDLRLNLPRELGALEVPLRTAVQERLSRGAVNLSLTCELAPERRREMLRVDHGLVAALAAELRAAATAAGLRDDLGISALLAVPGVIGAPADSQAAAALGELALAALGQALDELRANQQREGDALAADIRARHARLTTLAADIRAGRSQALKEYRDRLVQRLRELALDLPTDDERLLREIAFAAEKADVTEELVRLEEHLGKLAGLLDTAGPAGRELDFVCQEMGREINTLSAKVRDTGAAMLAMEFKAELNRIREQVQNLE